MITNLSKVIRGEIWSMDPACCICRVKNIDVGSAKLSLQSKNLSRIGRMKNDFLPPKIDQRSCNMFLLDVSKIDD